MPSILVEALDTASNTVYNATSGDDGIANMSLEIGNHVITAFWNDVNVGEINASINGADTFDLICRLTDLQITVWDKNGFVIPFVSLNLIYQYVTTKGNLLKTGSASGQTDLSGKFILNSTLPGINYFVNASIYGTVFNGGNDTVKSLPAQPIYNIIILCPSRTFALEIVDYNLEAIPNARIELVEMSSGIFRGAVANSAGAVTVEVTLGKYRLRIYANNVLLNETVVNVFSDTQSEIRCTLYNIQVSVTVVDYFQQPIPNVNVTLNGGGIGTRSATTQGDGTATFSKVIGGDMQVVTYSPGMESSYQAVNIQIEAPKTIRIQMAKYILIGPFLIETSIFATFIVILAAILLFVCIEIYRRRRVKSVAHES